MRSTPLPPLLQRFRLVALAEGVSYLLFAITMPLKYALDIPQPNYVVGMAHGVLFMLFIGLLLWAGLRHRWPLGRMALWVLASLLPFGTFVAERRLL